MHLNTENIDTFANYLQNLGKRPATIASYIRDVKRYVQYHNQHFVQHPVSLETISAYQDHLIAANEQPNSIRRHIIGIRQFIRFLEEEKILTKNAFFSEHIILPQRLEKAQKYLTDDQVATLVAAACEQESEIKSTRDAAIISLLAFEGIKASELIQLNWADLLLSSDPSSKSKSSLNISGLRARRIRLQPSTEKALLKYKSRYGQLRLANRKKMFVAFKGIDSCIVIPLMTRHGLKFMLAELANRLAWPKLNSELLRHYAIKNKLDNNFSVEDVMAHMGLKRIGNIAKYLNKNESQAQL